jgi:hypothetical protein
MAHPIPRRAQGPHPARRGQSRVDRGITAAPGAGRARGARRSNRGVGWTSPRSRPRGTAGRRTEPGAGRRRDRCSTRRGRSRCGCAGSRGGLAPVALAFTPAPKSLGRGNRRTPPAQSPAGCDTSLNVAVLETSLAKAVDMLRPRDDDEAGRQLARLRDELARLDAEVARLAGAIAAGGDLPALLDALHGREQRRQHLRREKTGRPRPGTRVSAPAWRHGGAPGPTPRRAHGLTGNAPCGAVGGPSGSPCAPRWPARVHTRGARRATVLHVRGPRDREPRHRRRGR